MLYNTLNTHKISEVYRFYHQILFRVFARKSIIIIFAPK